MPLFQFHKGAIRTVESHRQQSETIYFNSIKVRLEPLKQKDMFANVMYFNSIKVRLEHPSRLNMAPTPMISIP